MHEVEIQSKISNLDDSNAFAYSNYIPLIQEVALSAEIEQLLSDEVPDTRQY